MKNIIILSVCLAALGCGTDKEKNSLEQWKNEIISTEREFSEMAEKEGVPRAFLAYSDPDVVLLRNDSLVFGQNGMMAYFDSRKPFKGTVNLSWKPDFVDVSASGDLGYSYGKYIFTITDSLGISNESSGIFHTVWKRQHDGTWKFVWD